MRRYLVFYFLSFFLLALNPLNAQQTTGSKPPDITRELLHPDAPRETQMLSQLFGVWDAYQVKKNRDGTWASDTTRSEWRWYAILDGHAIQDDWIKFEATNGSAQTPQVVGTNIRIYNSSENEREECPGQTGETHFSTFPKMNSTGNKSGHLTEAIAGLKYPKSIANGNSRPCLSISYNVGYIQSRADEKTNLSGLHKGFNDSPFIASCRVLFSARMAGAIA